MKTNFELAGCLQTYSKQHKFKQPASFNRIH